MSEDTPQASPPAHKNQYLRDRIDPPTKNLDPSTLPKLADLDEGTNETWPRHPDGHIYVVSETYPLKKGPLEMWKFYGKPPAEPIELEATGKAPLVRCQRGYWVGQGNCIWEWYQCRGGASAGYTVCKHHGAQGAGRDTERAVANITHALGHPSTGTNRALAPLVRAQNVAKLLQKDANLRELYQEYLEDEALLDFRPQVALAKALLHRYLDISDLNKPDKVVGVGTLMEAPALRAIAALEKVVDLGTKYLIYEQKLGAITHQDLKRFLSALRRTIARFLPPEKVDDFYKMMKSEAGQRDSAIEV